MSEKRRKVSLDKQEEERKRLEERERILAQVQKMYSRYGEKVLRTILDYVYRENGLAVLLKKLGRVPPLGREDQQIMLLDYLSRYGPDHFLSAVAKSDKAKGIKEKIGKPVIEADWQLGEGVYEKGEREEGEDEEKLAEEEVEIVGRVEEVKKEKKELTWPEVERRSGKDRRQNNDRRRDVEMVFKNKRFGGERRSGIERRKNWPPAGGD